MDMILSKLRSWWWTGRPGVLQSMGSQRVGYDWATELTDNGAPSHLVLGDTLRRASQVTSGLAAEVTVPWCSPTKVSLVSTRVHIFKCNSCALSSLPRLYPSGSEPSPPYPWCLLLSLGLRWPAWSCVADYACCRGLFLPGLIKHSVRMHHYVTFLHIYLPYI